MNSMELPDSIGYIIRTAGIGQKKSELKRDVDYLLRVYEKICELGKQAKAPALVYKESNLVIRSIRDYFSPDIDEVLVDDPRAAQEGKEFFQEVMPEYAQLVKLHQERRPIFSRYQIEEQIEVLSRNKVPLPSGGSIVIDSTEALVAIDVNSGKMATEKGVEATAFKTNMEAAAETARQLRLRDLGGLIVIDFIDMRDRKHIRDVEKCLKDTLKSDKARVSVGRISQFGLLEMSRQRIKSALSEGSYLPCPHCEGSGRIKSAEAQALNFVRRLCAGLAKGQIGRVEGQVPLDVAAYLLNNKRAELIRLEQQHDLTIYIKGLPELTNGQMEIEFLRREKEELKEVQNYVEASSLRSAAPSEEAMTSQEATETPSTAEQEPEPVRASAAEGEADLDSAAASPPSGRKRRRPRRRRKPSEARPEQAAATESPDEKSTGESQPAAETAGPGLKPEAETRDQTAAATRPETVPESAPEPSSPISQRPEEQTPGSTTENQPASAATSGQQGDEQSMEKTDRPKPRRRKPAATRKPVVTEPQATAEPLATDESALAVDSDDATPETGTAPKPKTPRRRRSPAAKKPVEVNAEQQGSSLSTEPAAGEAVVSEGEEKPAEKPKRRRPRKPAAVKPANQAADTAEPNSAANHDKETAASNGNQTESGESKKKPARRRPSPKKTQEAKATAADAKQDKADSSSNSAKDTNHSESDSH